MAEVYSARMQTDDKVLAHLRQLYPGLSDQELIQISQNIMEYTQVAWEIYEECILSRNAAPELAHEHIDERFQ